MTTVSSFTSYSYQDVYTIICKRDIYVYNILNGLWYNEQKEKKRKINVMQEEKNRSKVYKSL